MLRSVWWGMTGFFSTCPPKGAGARTRRLTSARRALWLHARSARLDDSTRRRPPCIPFVESVQWRSQARSIAPFFKLADGNGAGATHGDDTRRRRAGTAHYLLAAKFRAPLSIFAYGTTPKGRVVLALCSLGAAATVKS
jgi:hypothetical protein